MTPQGGLRRAAAAAWSGLFLLSALLLAACQGSAATAPGGPSGGSPTATVAAMPPAAAGTTTPPVDGTLAAVLPAGATVLHRATADFADDGVEETVLVAGHGGSPERLSYRNTELIVLRPSAGGYDLAWRSGPLPGERAEPLQIMDLTGDGRPEALSVQALGAAGQTLYVLAARGESFALLAPRGGYFDGRPHFGEAGVRLEDTDGDGRFEIVADYGPAAARSEVYAWDGAAFVYRETPATDVPPVPPMSAVSGQVSSYSPRDDIIELLTPEGRQVAVRMGRADLAFQDGRPAGRDALRPGTPVEVVLRAGPGDQPEAEVVVILARANGPPGGEMARLQVTTDRTSYPPGGTVRFTLLLANEGATPVTLHYRDGQRFEVEVADGAGRVVWRYSDGMVFIQALGDVELSPGEQRTFRAEWDQRDRQGRQVPSGEYSVRAWATAENGPPPGEARLVVE